MILIEARTIIEFFLFPAASDAEYDGWNSKLITINTGWRPVWKFDAILGNLTNPRGFIASLVSQEVVQVEASSGVLSRMWATISCYFSVYPILITELYFSVNILKKYLHQLWNVARINQNYTCLGHYTLLIYKTKLWADIKFSPATCTTVAKYRSLVSKDAFRFYWKCCSVCPSLFR